MLSEGLAAFNQLSLVGTIADQILGNVEISAEAFFTDEAGLDESRDPNVLVPPALFTRLAIRLDSFVSLEMSLFPSTMYH